jgi:hypothetical protein
MKPTQTVTQNRLVVLLDALVNGAAQDAILDAYEAAYPVTTSPFMGRVAADPEVN